VSPVPRSGEAGMVPCGAGRERLGVISPGAPGDWSDDLHAEIAMTPVRPTVAKTPAKLLERRITSSFCSSSEAESKTHVLGRSAARNGPQSSAKIRSHF
jgi:hypothetical protein